MFKRFRDAITGKFLTRRSAQARPDTSVSESVPLGERRLLHAHTDASGISYPPYVNATRETNGRTTLFVRSPPGVDGLEGPTASISLSHSEATRLGRALLLAMCVLMLAGWRGGCSSAPTKPDLPTLPETVPLVIEKPAPLPPVLTNPLPRAPRADGKLSSYKAKEQADEAIIDMADCHRRIAAALSRGEPADPATCKNPLATP